MTRMAWYVRYGLGKAPPRAGDAPGKRRGWVMVTPLKREAAIRLGREKTAAGMTAEAGQIVKGKPQVRFFPGSFKDMADGREARWPKTGRLKPENAARAARSIRPNR
jgi:hypothetical protein